MADNPQKPGACTPAFSPSDHLSLAGHHADLDHPPRDRHGAVGGRAGAGLVAGFDLQRSGRLCRAFMPSGRPRPSACWCCSASTWSLVFHFLNGIRHLAWDLGYGFDKATADADSVIAGLRSVAGAGARRLRLRLDRPCGVSAMSSLQTPLHKVQGLGASHSGTGHFWRERVTAVALIPLSLWFALCDAGPGRHQRSHRAAVPRPSLERAADGAPSSCFSLYHMYLGLQVVIDDYVHTAGHEDFPAAADPLCRHRHRRDLPVRPRPHRRPIGHFQRYVMPAYKIVDHTFDVVVVGAGGAGLRATLECALAGPEDRLHHQGLSHPQPHRGGAGRRRGSAGQYGRGQLALAHVRHRQGFGLAGRPGFHRISLPQRAGSGLRAGAFRHALLAAPRTARSISAPLAA